MTFFREHPWSRWAVPVAAFGVIGATAAVTNQQANADPGLPHRTAAQLLADVQSSNVQSLSGTIVQTADLGLPQLPGLSGGAGGPGGGGSDSSSPTSSLTTLLSGTHTWRVWVNGSTQQRLALVDGSNESDIIRNGQDVWVWSSADKSAVHRTLPTAMQRLPRHSMTPNTSPSTPGSSPGTGPSGAATTAPTTPEEAATQALAFIGQDTTVTTNGTATVAGRPAYELVLIPKDKATRIASVRIAIDGTRHVPVRVQVYSTQLANPAFQVGFKSIDFTKPEASRFTFTPPAGTKVTDQGTLQAPTKPKASGTNPAPTTPGGTSAMPPKPKVVGSGWSSVVVTTLPKGTSTSGPSSSSSPQQSLMQQLGPIVGSLPQVSGSWGHGRLLQGTLFSAVLTDDGRVAVGAVGPDQLYAALAAK
ncbi:MAG: LolA family protein [Intrasporangium sp.]|uniref:LolA family protein n=1 Tax=Intrasporangium sp. TaxID=1925024 RepID=UPI003F7F13E3